MSQPRLNLMTVFGEALERSDPADRAAYLDQACGRDADLRRKVEELLAAHAGAGRFLEPGSIPATSTSTFAPESPTQSLESPKASADSIQTADYRPTEAPGLLLAGRYRLIEQIGEGGMGSVWMAQQSEPVKRTVAIKLIKTGMDSKTVLTRFEAERQALALMDHPNIARVFDAGVSADGRPFFVMELIKGVPITQFCDERKLSPKERLELFIPVCQAIQHAHQKGVIHRDIKPSNVLVIQYDDRAAPKVIDFGVAKAAGQPLTDHTLATGFGTVVGTPEYMSPEQAGFNQLDVDTRSDVYALGVLLYELLTGMTPLDRKSLGKAALLEVLRIVRDVEPLRPSAKLSTCDALPTIAANRSMEPSKLSRLFKGELDWVVMKALEKDRTRRYETANGLARDIQRYLADEVIEARAPSAGYRLKKFVHRNRGQVAAVGMVLLVLVVGIIGTTWGLLLADQARRDEASLRGTAERLQDEAIAGRKKAEKQALSAAVDLDLEYCNRNDIRTGLLRLARRLKSLPPEAVELRQFITLSLFAWAQCDVKLYGKPLLFSETFPGDRVDLCPDGRTLFRRLGSGSSELRDLPTGRRLVVLAEKDGYWSPPIFSRDNRTACYRAGNAIQVWDLEHYKTRSVIRPESAADHHVYMDPLGTRVITLHYLDDRSRNFRVDFRARMLVRLWDANNGRLIAALEHPEGLVSGWNDRGAPDNFCRFSPDGQTVLTAGQGDVVRVWSATDGRLLHKLTGHGSGAEFASFSPSGRWAISGNKERVLWWDTRDWKQDGPPCALGADQLKFAREYFLDEDTVSLVFETGSDQTRDVSNELATLCIRGDRASYPLSAIATDGENIVTQDSHVYSRQPFRRIENLDNRIFPAGLRKLAPDGRFLVYNDPAWVRLIDLATDKQVGPGNLECLYRCSAPEWGFAGFTVQHNFFALPHTDLAFDPDTLQLWTEVLVRGELDASSGFIVNHDEAAWEAKRQELLRRPKSAGGFPFPGAFAEDRLYWVRKRLDQEGKDADTLGLLNRLIAAEPTAAHYSRRAEFHQHVSGRNDLCVADMLKAYELEVKATGRAARIPEPPFGPAREIVYTAGLPREQYELVMRWYNTYAPDNTVRERGIIHYRIGQYREAIELLSQEERRASARMAAAMLATPNVAPTLTAALFERSLIERDEVKTVTIALCLLRLGRFEEARGRLAQARTDAVSRRLKHEWFGISGKEKETDFLRNAEVEIERK